MSYPYHQNKEIFLKLSARLDDQALNNMQGKSFIQFQQLKTKQITQNNSPRNYFNQIHQPKFMTEDTQLPQILKQQFNRNINLQTDQQQQYQQWLLAEQKRRMVVKPIIRHLSIDISNSTIELLRDNLIKPKIAQIPQLNMINFKIGDKPENLDEYLFNLKDKINRLSSSKSKESKINYFATERKKQNNKKPVLK